MRCIKLHILPYFLCLISGFCFGQKSNNQTHYNYAYSCDGFNQDRDDIAASAMTLALFDRVGLADRLVHFHFNTNFGGEPTQAEQHRKSALETAVLFGIIDDVNGNDAYFDVSRSEAERFKAIDHLAAQIGKANIDEPLMIFAAGGVQLPYLALEKAIGEGAEKSTLESVVFVSHAEANEITRQKNDAHPEYGNNWSDLKQLSPHVRFIDFTSPLVNARRDGGVNLSQNSTAWNQALRGNKGKGVSDWQWLKEYGEQVEGFGFSGTKGAWLLTRLKAAGAPELGLNGNAEGDASDAGMVFTQLPGGITDATMEEIRDFFMKETPAPLQDEWKPLLDVNMSHWEKFIGVPHTTVKGLQEGTFQSDNVHVGTPMGLENDPKNVMTIIEQDGEPVLAITGEIYGCVSTKGTYGDYHLSLQFKWGEKKWEPRLDKLRDSGVLYHSFGDHGGIWNVWKACVESQVQEGECGDIYLLGSHQGNPNVFAKTVPTEGNRFPTWDPKGTDGHQKSRIIKKGDFEKPNGEWNTMEIYALGDEAFHLVNGHVVMHITQIKRRDQPLTSGHIQIQSEGAEIYYRDVKIRGIHEFPEDILSAVGSN